MTALVSRKTYQTDVVLCTLYIKLLFLSEVETKVQMIGVWLDRGSSSANKVNISY